MNTHRTLASSSAFLISSSTSHGPKCAVSAVPADIPTLPLPCTISLPSPPRPSPLYQSPCRLPLRPSLLYSLPAVSPLGPLSCTSLPAVSPSAHFRISVTVSPSALSRIPVTVSPSALSRVLVTVSPSALSSVPISLPSPRRPSLLYQSHYGLPSGPLSPP